MLLILLFLKAAVNLETFHECLLYDIGASFVLCNSAAAYFLSQGLLCELFIP